MITPSLADLMRWMSAMPSAFRAQPEGFAGGEVRVAAVVADLFETLTGSVPGAATLASFEPAEISEAERNRLRWVLAGAHLLWHSSFTGVNPKSKALEKFFIQELATVAGVVSAELLDREEERREELIRRALRCLNLHLLGETANEEEDRFNQVDSVERQRVLQAAALRSKRAQEVREAMARKASQEAAAKVSRE